MVHIGYDSGGVVMYGGTFEQPVGFEFSDSIDFGTIDKFAIWNAISEY